MKVLFVFNGIPHYYIPILNRLNAISDMEIQLIIPSETSKKSIGEGVHQTMEGVKFKIHQLQEYKTIYGKAFFKRIIPLLLKEKPEIIVCGWPHILGFTFNPFIFFSLKRKKIKLINKIIPYNIPLRHKALKFYKEKGGALNEEMKEKSWNGILFKIKYTALTLAYKIYFNLVDAHVNYVEEAFEILGSYGVPKNKIFITYNSPDTDFIFATKEKIKKLPPILSPNKYRLLHVGRLVKWKKVDMLIHVFKRLKEQFSEAELVIIGSGPEEKNLTQLVKDLNLENSTLFTGSIYDMDILGKYYTASTIYVLAGVGGLSINEAMCFEKPIVCSECDGTEKKLVRDGVNGKIFKNDDAEDLYQQLHYLLKNEELIKTMGEHSLNIIQNEINIHTILKGYVSAFNYVTKNRYKLEY